MDIGICLLILKVVKLCLTPVVWILCIPIRILHSILRWIYPCATDYIVQPRIMYGPEVLSLKHQQQMEAATKDKIRAGNRLVKERQRVKDLEDEWSQSQHESTADNDEITTLQHSIEQLTQNLKENEKDKADQQKRIKVYKTENESYRQKLEKVEKELRLWKKEAEKLGEQVTALECKLKEKGAKLEASEKENVVLKTKTSHLEDQLAETATALREMETVKDETQLSKMMRDNNSDIAELSDRFRPTKLAEMMNELYDNQWTDAFTYLEDNWDPADGRAFSDVKCVEFLMDILMEVYTFCHSKAIDDWNDCIKKLFWTADTNDEKELLENLKDVRKKNAFIALPHILKQCNAMLSALRLTSDDGFIVSQEEQNELQGYIYECVRLSWLMSLQDPPTCLVCEGWTSVVAQTTANASPTPESTCQSNNTTISHGGNSENQYIGHKAIEVMNPERRRFNREVYREYTKRGAYIEYIVWPIMYLHENGPLLNKGVAQGIK